MFYIFSECNIFQWGKDLRRLLLPDKNIFISFFDKTIHMSGIIKFKT